MNPPTIQHLKNTGSALIATIDGQEVQLTTFREGLWLQGVVYLPPPFGEKCPPIPIFTDPADDESDLVEVEDCILDREVAAWMGEFAAGKLKKGMLR